MMDDPSENNHGGVATSVEAWQRELRAAPGQRRRVLELIHEAGARGLTVKEAAERMGLGMNHISGRFTELRAPGRIQRLNWKREGCWVHVAVEPVRLGPEPKEKDLLS